MRQSLSEGEQAEDFSAPLCFTHWGNGTLIWFRKSPQCICRAFPISTSQNTRRWLERDRQNELNEDFFFSLSACFCPPFLAFNKRVQSRGGSSSNQHFAAGESDDGRGTLAPDPHLPQKTEGKKEWKNN